MIHYNCIMVYNQKKDALLFCKRMSDPYKGLYNLVGGKEEANENGYAAAYRELHEETGITRLDIRLHHMMDFCYYNQECMVSIYVGVLEKEVKLKEEKHPLCWLDLKQDFFDMKKFAGEGNIGHMVEQVRKYGINEKQEKNYVYILECKDGSYYTGWTNHLEKRVADHNAGKGAKYTRGRGPLVLRYYEVYETKEEALKREIVVKKLTKEAKRKLFQK